MNTTYQRFNIIPTEIFYWHQLEKAWRFRVRKREGRELKGLQTFCGRG